MCVSNADSPNLTQMSESSLINLPTPENAVIRLHEDDNIAIARAQLATRQHLKVNGLEITVKDPVPAGHKVALKSISEGEQVLRYGQMIGLASTNIEAGQHVHIHNLAFEEHSSEYVFPEKDAALPPPLEPVPTFMGYQRSDGRVGTRNYIAVVAASNCSAYLVSQAAQSFPRDTLPPNIDGVAAFPIDSGCGMQIGADTDQLARTLVGVMKHPNVAAAVIIGLGCEMNLIDRYLRSEDVQAGRIAGFEIQDAGGTQASLEAARGEIRKMMELASGDQRVETPASKLMLGLQCGGSDSFSGITANPALGYCSDLLVRAGGTAVLGETTETFGAEHLLVLRSRNRAAAEKYLSFVESYKSYLQRFDCNFNANPTPGNKAGGITTILEKSLGAVAKAGTTPLMDAVEYSERIHSSGMVFMNTPGYDPASLAGLAAGGANVMAFTTGRGSVSGFPTVPVIKIASNSSLYNRMADDMDINAGRIADGAASIEEVGKEIFDLLIRVASGEAPSSERLYHDEFVPWSLGPVL